MSLFSAELIGKLETTDASIVVTTVFAHLGRLPSLPQTYTRLVQTLSDPKADLRQVVAIISEDPGLAGRVLHLANSAMFGAPGNVVSLGNAIQIVGMHSIRGIVLAEGALRSFPTALHAPLTLDRLWKHAVETARFAQDISMVAGLRSSEAESAFTAGLLHDIGRLVLAEAHGEAYFGALSASRDDRVPMVSTERTLFDCDHAEVGATMLKLWNLPDVVCDAVRWHHAPARLSQKFTVASAVHLADALAHHQPGLAPYTPGKLDEEHLAKCGLTSDFDVLADLIEQARC
jgi:putative nucleotidyltransferase with HDIG domain